MTTIEQALDQARLLGEEHAINAVGWWEQDAIGGRQTDRKAAKDGARWILKGLEDGDPEVYDAIPQPDLSGQWADGYTPHQLAIDCGATEGDFSYWPTFHEVVQELCNTYEEAFQETVKLHVTQLCQAHLLP